MIDCWLNEIEICSLHHYIENQVHKVMLVTWMLSFEESAINQISSIWKRFTRPLLLATYGAWVDCPKTGSNRAQNTANKLDIVLDVLGLLMYLLVLWGV